MAEPKTRPTDVDPRAYLSAIEDERQRADALRLLDIYSEVTGEKAVMWGASIIGFGTYTIGEGRKAYAWPVTGFAAPKGKFTLYAMAGNHEVAALLDGLGKHTRGGGCTYFKRLSDIDEGVLRQVIAAGVAVVKSRLRT